MVKLDKATARRLAVRADVDPRTIVKAARGERVIGMSGQRARAILAEVGLIPQARAAGAESKRGRP